MSKFEDNMEDLFEIEVEATDIEPAKPRPPREADKDDQTKDYEFTRGQLYNLLSKGQEALDGALEVAQESGHPRAYEVAVNAMKQVADASDKLIDLQKKMKDLEAPTKNSVNNKTTNNLFVGSTADLQKMLKQINKQEETGE
ncbi:terminase small subunit [Cyanophage S-RIM44]|uniref:Terminase small subunit n=2 Tax=Vellamovirus TaxID=2733139 RepID=A0A127KMP6_9CAUD|nr:terminase small subunit [Prochlorococcus phage Syn1]AMO43352.1 terminase small subunit [Cyanophage S-RIM44]ADO99210.1 terminase DNA packaging enzyme small subunit [Prochlorococcus phage Syn1]AOO11824.1 terminase small subunit [Cyanophage S-RIM44]AOO12525.1 terminase small subunit [Cyanophage S-RIM44]AOO12991.1 terminase small subunit [Cyanophage S-RIM44]